MSYRPLVPRDFNVREIKVENGTAQLPSGQLHAGVILTIRKHKQKETSKTTTVLTDQEALWLADQLINTVRSRLPEDKF